MRVTRRAFGLLTTVVSITASNGTSAQTIDTRGPVHSSVSAEAGIFGQSFVVPNAYPVLTDFSFWVGQFATTYDYRAALYAFGSGAPVGSPLYSSDVRMSPLGEPVEQTFLTGPLSLTPGQSYFALIQRVGDGLGLELGFARPDVGFASTYADGSFYATFLNPSDPTTVAYGTDIFAPGSDLEFVAHFDTDVNAVPEPASLILLATGLVGISFAVGRRRREKQCLAGG